MQWIQRQFPEQHVVYVLGNHEFYHQSIPELTERLKRETDGKHIHLLENDAIEIEGFTFLGCTLWTDFRIWHDPEAAMLAANRGMSDFTVIEVASQNRVLDPQDTVKLNAESEPGQRTSWLNVIAQKPSLSPIMRPVPAQFLHFMPGMSETPHLPVTWSP